MVDPATRELQVTYGALLVGGTSTNLLLHGPVRHTLERNPDLRRAVVEFQFVVKETTESGFVATCAQVERELSQPFQALSCAVGSQIQFVYGTPPLQEASASFRRVPDDNVATGRSRLYEARIEVRLNADYLSTLGLAESSVDVTHTPANVRRVRIAGAFTATGSSTNARAAYDAAISAFTTSALASIGGTYELAEVPVSRHDTQNHILEFEQVFDEVVFKQAGGSPDATKIVRQSYRVTISDRHPGDSRANPKTGGGGPSSGGPPERPVRRLTTFIVDYEASVRRELSTDLASVYESDVRPFLITQLATEGATGLAIVEEDPQYHRDENRITVRLVALAATKGQKIIEREITLRTQEKDNTVLVPGWTGKPHSKYVYPGPGDVTRTIQERTLRLAPEPTEAAVRDEIVAFGTALQSGLSGIRDASGGVWTAGEVVSSIRPVEYGDVEKLAAWEVILSVAMKYFEPINSGSGQGAGAPGGATTPTALTNADVTPPVVRQQR